MIGWESTRSLGFGEAEGRQVRVAEWSKGKSRNRATLWGQEAHLHALPVHVVGAFVLFSFCPYALV